MLHEYNYLSIYTNLQLYYQPIFLVLIANEAHNQVLFDLILLRRRRRNFQNTMGQRIKPSFIDVLVMNKHYGCLSMQKKTLFESN